MNNRQTKETQGIMKHVIDNYIFQIPQKKRQLFIKDGQFYHKCDYSGQRLISVVDRH